MMKRTGLNPIRDALAEAQLYEFFRSEEVDLLLSYTIKPIVLGLPAAARAGVPNRIALITGLGSVFFAEGLWGKLLKQAAALLYRRALWYSTKVISQNEDIIGVLKRVNAIRASNDISIVRGSGVDINHYAWRPVSLNKWSFLLVGRMLYDKGVREFVDAARALKKADSRLHFILLGSVDSNPSAIPKKKIEEWVKEGVVQYVPAVSDVRPYLEDATVLIHPSYHEGLPRAVLEAMALGRPIITTDAIGCRETLLGRRPIANDGISIAENGIMVSVGDAGGIVAAIRYLMAKPKLVAEMGLRGRRLVEREFDVRIINRKMLELICDSSDVKVASVAI
jgi:glycosyltransferase involved in cell wall biosynthesis